MKKVLLTSVLVLFVLCAFNLSAYAIGMGVYGIGRFGYVELPDADTSGSKFNGGAGFILDTAVASDTLFNYRMNLGIEYMETNYAVYDSIPSLSVGAIIL